ncbi:MAG: hypothetical protein J0H64_01570 [Actinobacteria bacterium]|nr:hypothetical protein [Actinomycetota bacterium]
MSDAPIPADAAALLAAHDRTVVAQRPPAPSRALIRFRIWSAACAAAYVVTIMLIATTPNPGSSVNTTLVPVAAFILASALATETEQRFAVRRRARAIVPIALGLVAAAFVVIFWGTRTPAPLWAAALFGVAAFVALALPEWRRLRSTRPADDTRDTPWRNRPLSPETRLITWGMAAYLGMLLVLLRFDGGAEGQPLVFLALYGPLIFLTFVPRWGLRRLGAEWGPLHWAAFGVGLVAIMVVAPMTHAGLPGSDIACIGAGIAVFLLLGLCAQLPLRGSSGDPIRPAR